MLAVLKTRYDAFAQRVLSSLSEIERRDVRAFDRWFYANGGWRWLIGVVRRHHVRRVDRVATSRGT